MKDISAKIMMPISYMGHEDVTAFVRNSNDSLADMVAKSGYEPPN